MVLFAPAFDVLGWRRYFFDLKWDFTSIQMAMPKTIIYHGDADTTIPLSASELFELRFKRNKYDPEEEKKKIEERKRLVAEHKVKHEGCKSCCKEPDMPSVDPDEVAKLLEKVNKGRKVAENKVTLITVPGGDHKMNDELLLSLIHI